MMSSLKFGPKVVAALLLLLVTGCGFAVRVPFVGVGVRVLRQDVSAKGEERIVTTYIHDGKADRLEVYHGRIKLNAVDYGPVEPGDQVVLTEDGLLINGEHRNPASDPIKNADVRK